MPIPTHLLDSLRKQYGGKRGTSIMYAMENSGGKTGKTFKKAQATAASEGGAHVAKNLASYNARKTGKGQSSSAILKEAKREAKMSPKAHAKVEAKEKAKMGAKAHAKHEAREQAALKKAKAKKK